MTKYTISFQVPRCLVHQGQRLSLFTKQITFQMVLDWNDVLKPVLVLNCRQQRKANAFPIRIALIECRTMHIYVVQNLIWFPCTRTFVKLMMILVTWDAQAYNIPYKTHTVFLLFVDCLGYIIKSYSIFWPIYPYVHETWIEDQFVSHKRTGKINLYQTTTKYPCG